MDVAKQNPVYCQSRALMNVAKQNPVSNNRVLSNPTKQNPNKPITTY
jgi:hypothetical protein